MYLNNLYEKSAGKMIVRCGVVSMNSLLTSLKVMVKEDRWTQNNNDGSDNGDDNLFVCVQYFVNIYNSILNCIEIGKKYICVTLFSWTENIYMSKKNKLY